MRMRPSHRQQAPIAPVHAFTMPFPRRDDRFPRFARTCCFIRAVIACVPRGGVAKATHFVANARIVKSEFFRKARIHGRFHGVGQWVHQATID